MTRAVCVRCGGERGTWEGVCPACGHRPDAEGSLVAWLLSSEHLDDGALDRAAERIRRGEPVRASERMLERARVALGRHRTSDPGLDRPARLGLLAGSLLFTALPGMALWWWWREERPRAAWQALWVSLPAGLVAWTLLGWRALTSGLPALLGAG